MAFTRRTVRTSEDTSGGGSFTQATAAYNQAAGDLIVVAVRWEGNDSTVSVSDTATNTWVSRPKGNDPTNHMNVQLFYVLNCLGNAANVVTATFADNSSAYRSLNVMPYLPGGTTSFVAAPAIATGTGTAVTSASYTAGKLAVTQVAEFAGTSATAGSGWANVYEQPLVGSHLEDRIDNPGGTIVGAMTLGGSAAWVVTSASFTDSGASDTALSVENAQATLTGQTVVMDSGAVVTNGALALTGSDVSLLLGAGLSVTEGVLTLSGQDVQLVANASIVLPVTEANLALAGQDVPFEMNTPWTEAVLTLTGSDVQMIAGGAVVLAVTEASLTLSGGTINLVLDEDFTVTVTSANLTLTGQDVTFAVGGNNVIDVGSATLTLTGQDVGISPSYTLPASSGTTQPRNRRRISLYGR